MLAEMLVKQAAENERRMVQMLQTFQIGSTTTTPKFEPFQPDAELFKDYIKRFETFLLANSVAQSKAAQVFHTNQSLKIYKTLETAASQLQPPRNINAMEYDQVVLNMEKLFNPATFVIRERYKFWSNGKRKPGESV